MKLIVEGDANEIAALVLAVQGRQEEQQSTEDLAEAIRDTLLEFAEKSESSQRPAEQ